MTTFNIEYDISELKKLAEQFTKTVENAPEAALPNTAAAFREATKAIQNMWTNTIRELPGATSKMVQSIRHEKLGSFHARVYSDSRQLEALNNGSKAVEYDMKLTHPYGKKSRVSKKGIPYLIIPFRWGTPNDKGTKRAHFNNFIPQKNYKTAVKGLEVSRVNFLKNYFEKNFKGENIERWGYDWVKGSRLSDDQAWNDRSAGMVRMKDVTGSTYFTFRIISAKSPANSWIYHKDAKPAANFMPTVLSQAQQILEDYVRQGAAKDQEMINNLLNR